MPYNRGRKKGEFIQAKIFHKICPFCKNKIKTKREKQVYCNLSCYSKSEELKNFAKESSMIKGNSTNKYHFGFRLSEETKNKIRNNPNRHSFPKGIKNPGVNKSPETIQKIKDKRLFQKVLKKDTKPEIIIQDLLKNLNIKFSKHKPILGIEHPYQCDLFIMPNIVIECDGDYFHKYPDGRVIDKLRTKEMEDEGYKVIRLWEHDIKKDLNFCKNKILEAIA